MARATNPRGERWLALSMCAALLCPVCLVSGARPAQADIDVLTSHGPKGGVIQALAVDPIEPRRVSAATNRGGVFATEQVNTCVGDCDGKGTVTVSELVKGVNIALGAAALDDCDVFDSNSDHKVTVDELVAAVNTALNGCAGRIDVLRASLAADGFTVADGSFSEVDISVCCDPGNSCYGNNPASPYLTAKVPPAPGQVVGNDSPDTFRFQSDEALLLVGTTPPPAAYFGFTPYLFDRDNGAGSRVPVFASLSETLNHEVIGVEGGPGVHGRPTVIIVCADAAVDARVRAALTSAEYPAGSVNTLVFDPTVARFGLEAADDQFAVIARIAIPDVKADLDAYLADPPFTVLRLTPATAVPSLFARPPSRTKSTLNSEDSLATSVFLLGHVLRARFNATHDATELSAFPLVPDPYACISGLTECLGDNRDTTYPRSAAFAWPGAGDFVVVFGVDHVRTGKVTYASATVLETDHQAGITSATSHDWPGSAAVVAPSVPNVDRLYAYAFARPDVGGGLVTRIVSIADCPSGIADGASARIVFRTYVEPGFATAPDPSTLLLDRVLLFRAP